MDSLDTLRFLSIQAQDFIEDGSAQPLRVVHAGFLSIQAQDFIEEVHRGW